MENWTDNLIYLFWTAYPPLGRSDHHSKKERFPGGGSPSCYPLRGLGAFFPRKSLKSPAIRGPTCPFNPGASNRINFNYFIILKNHIMADLKRRTLQLSSGKQIKLFGNSVAISKSLEIGEGYAPNILSVIEEQPDHKNPAGLSN